MREYNIFRNNESKHIIAVKKGWSWTGFLFGWTWLIVKGFWKYLFYYFFITFIIPFILMIMTMFYRGDISPKIESEILLISMVLGFFIRIYLGLKGNNIREMYLVKSDYSYEGGSVGDSAKKSINNFYQKDIKQQFSFNIVSIVLKSILIIFICFMFVVLNLFNQINSNYSPIINNPLANEDIIEIPEFSNVKIDEYTIGKRAYIDAKSKRIFYDYTILVKLEELDQYEFSQNIERHVRSNACVSKKVKGIFESGLSLEYRYYDVLDKPITRFIVSESDCR